MNTETDKAAYALGEQTDGSFILRIEPDAVKRMRRMYDDAYFKANNITDAIGFGRSLVAIRELSSLCSTVIMNALGPWQ